MSADKEVLALAVALYWESKNLPTHTTPSEVMTVWNSLDAADRLRWTYKAKTLSGILTLMQNHLSQ